MLTLELTLSQQLLPTWTGGFDFGTFEQENELQIFTVSLKKGLRNQQIVNAPYSHLFAFTMVDLHEGAVTSVQFHPTDSSKVLTNGLDSCVKLVDIRTSTPILEFKHPNFLTTYGWSTASLSPDGKIGCLKFF